MNNMRFPGSPDLRLFRRKTATASDFRSVSTKGSRSPNFSLRRRTTFSNAREVRKNFLDFLFEFTSEMDFFY